MLFEGIVLGRYSSAALAGGGMGLLVLFFLFTIFLTFVVGAAVPISRHLGAGEKRKASRLFGNALGATFGVGVIFALISIVFGGLIFGKVFGATGEVEKAATDYFRVLALFIPIIALNFTGTGILRATGDAFAAMSANLTANLVHFGGVILLVYGSDKLGIPPLGAAGAALALGIAQTVGFLVQLRFILGGRTRIRLHISDFFRLKFEQIKRVLKTGIPATLEQFIWMTGQLALLAYIARLGQAELAAHQIVIRLTQTLGVIYQGLAFGNMALCGHSFGAGELEKAARTSKNIRYLSLLVGAIIGALVYIFRTSITGLFTYDAEVISLTLILMPILALQQIPKSQTMITASELRARGDLNFIAMTGGVFVALNEVVLSAIAVFVMGWGLPAVWALLVVDEIERLVTHLLRIRRGLIHNV